MAATRNIEIFAKKTIDRSELFLFIKEVLGYLKPNSFTMKHYTNRKNKYNDKKMEDAFYQEMNFSHEKMRMSISCDNGAISIHSEVHYIPIKISISITDDSYKLAFAAIERFIKEEAMCAIESDLHDTTVQNQRFISMLELFGEDPNNYPKCKGTVDEVEIDIEKNPGYYYNVRGFMLGAFYRMWFGKEAYDIYDKEALRSFPCYENVVLDNDVTRITLYENILDYNKKENRDKQWEFREKLHVDEIGHRMQKEEEEEKKKNLDPAINIKQGSFEHGGVRLIQTYLKDGENVPRSKADSVEEVEMDENGKEVYRCIREL